MNLLAGPVAAAGLRHSRAPSPAAIAWLDLVGFTWIPLDSQEGCAAGGRRVQLSLTMDGQGFLATETQRGQAATK